MRTFSIKTLLLLSCLIFLSLQAYTITCPEGQTIKDNPDKTPTANGCGGSDSQRAIEKILNPFRQTFTPCCNDHDICFNTCYTSGDVKAIFNSCNSNFKKCLNNNCDKKSTVKRIACKAQAKLFYQAVDNYGEKYFYNDQKVACICA